jgi:hypothetical protein
MLMWIMPRWDVRRLAAAAGRSSICSFITPQRSDRLLAHRRAFAPTFDDLQIGASGGSLLAAIHGGGQRANRWRIAQISEKIKQNRRKRGTPATCNFQRSVS